MLELAMQMLFCLLISALLGGIIGYMLGRIAKCDTQAKEKTPPLYDYDEEQQLHNTQYKETFAQIPDAVIKKSEKGIKPISLTTPKDGVADDLKKISGVGLKIENSLYELGIFHFYQIAEWSHDNITWIDEYLSYKGRVVREEWVEQAKHLIIKDDKHH